MDSRRYEFHSHTFYSDGALSPVELVRRAYVAGHALIALTDHADFTNLEHVLKCQRKIKGEISWDIQVLVGVELTHIPKDKIAKLAARAKRLGAEIVVCHGESPVEPVEPGTNMAGASCRDVDIIAHPGNTLTVEEAETAKDNNVYLELAARQGHNRGNTNVAKVAHEVGAPLIVNTDAHSHKDLISVKQAIEIAHNAGVDRVLAEKIVLENPLELLKKLHK